MKKLGDLLAELCPNGVEYKALENVSEIKRGIRVVKSQLNQNEKYPVYQNSLTPLGFFEKTNAPANTTFIIVAGAAGEIGYSTCDFWAADDCFYFLPSAKLLGRYIYHFLLMKQEYLRSKVRKASIPRLSRSAIEKLEIPVPPLEIQQEIVRILDQFTGLTAELTTQLAAELTARKKQYEYYRDQLLTFGTKVIQKPLEAEFPSIRNGFVGTITSFFSDKKNGVRYLEGRDIHNGTISDDKAVYVTKEFHNKHLKTHLRPDDILVVQSGHVGECAVVGDKYAGANCHALIVMSNAGNCDSRYVAYYLQSSEGKRKLASITTGGTVKHILASKIKKLIVPFPPIEEQRRIVSILDRFNALYNDLNSGLPAEIEARQKQYEYYRDKLLTFKEL